jgi:hypothetical protein
MSGDQSGRGKAQSYAILKGSTSDRRGAGESRLRTKISPSGSFGSLQGGAKCRRDPLLPSPRQERRPQQKTRQRSFVPSAKPMVQASPIAAPTTKKLRRPDLAGFIMRSNPIAFGFWPTERPGHPLDDPKGARSCLAAPGFPLALPPSAPAPAALKAATLQKPNDKQK